MAPQTVPVADELLHRLEQLEERVRRLEEGHVSLATPLEQRNIPDLTHDLHLPENAESLVPLFGKALLALAGAYLLRALTTSTLVPSWIGITLAIAYSVFWMAMAARLSISSKLNGAVYMTISVLAFSPMLWETTVNLHLLPTAGSALALTGYVILGLVLAWRGRLNAIAWLAAAAGAVTALALCAGTFHLAPFSFALLAMAAALEVAAVEGVWLGPRRLIAFAADLAILWLIYIYGRSDASLPEGYHAIPGWLGWGAPAALLIIFISGTATRTLRRHLDVTVFETLELVAAVGLFVFAATRQQGSVLLPGLILIACGVLCYVLAFKRLIKESHQLNLYAYSAFGLALVLLGTVFSMPRAGMTILWAFASLVLLWVSARVASYHTLAFLAAAGIASGLAWDTYTALLRDGTHVSLTAGSAITFAAMGVAYVRLRGVPRALAATMFTWIAAAWLASLLIGALPAGADAAWRAAIRTSLIVAAAVVVAMVARYQHIRELYWLVPGAMVIALCRLIFDDVPVGRPETLFISLLFYGGALLVLSKLMHDWRHGEH